SLTIIRWYRPSSSVNLVFTLADVVRPSSSFYSPFLTLHPNPPPCVIPSGPGTCLVVGGNRSDSGATRAALAML
ncbi:hypothetical protein BU14_0177s0020, partial [Porphyra umbilicalis]